MQLAKKGIKQKERKASQQMNEPMILGKVLKVTFNPVKFIILWYVEISLFFHLVTRVTVNTEKSDSTANALLTSCFLLM